MSKWAVRLGGEVVWTCDGVEEQWDTEQEAIEALEKEFDEIQEDVKAGYLDDVCFEDYRIVEVV